jgi:hypothetical protein
MSFIIIVNKYKLPSYEQRELVDYSPTNSTQKHPNLTPYMVAALLSLGLSLCFVEVLICEIVIRFFVSVVSVGLFGSFSDFPSAVCDIFRWVNWRVCYAPIKVTVKMSQSENCEVRKMNWDSFTHLELDIITQAL